MMRQMREATKPIMILAAGAFVALMVFQWGMDISGRSSGGQPDIGKVNGTPITYNQYETAYQNLYNQQQQAQSAPISNEQNTQIENAAFDQVVNQILVEQELKRRGITVTNQEIEEWAKYSPPPNLRAQFTDSAGNFDLKAWQTALSEAPQSQLLALQSYYGEIIPQSKLQQQLSSGIFPSDGQLWQSWKDQHEQVQVRYVALDPGTRYPDDSVPVSEAEIRQYYLAHQDSFKVPAKATVKAVVLLKAPTAADTAASRQKAIDVLKQIHTDSEFAAVARKESADSASGAQGGDLGVIARGQVPGPLDSAIFAAPIGKAVGPVETGYGFHILEVSKRWGRDSARVRHILIPIQRTDSSEMDLLNEADSLETLGSKMSLDRAAANLGLRVQTATLTSAFPFIPGAGLITEGSDWLFHTAAAGQVSSVFENAQSYYCLELESRRPAGVLPLDEVSKTIEAKLRLQKKMALAEAEARRILAEVKSGQPLARAAESAGLQIHAAGPFAQDAFVPGLGRRNDAIGTAFGLKPGQISDVVTTNSNVFIIEDVKRIAADSTAWLKQKAQQRQAYISAQQQQRFEEWLQALRASATIVDNRATVLHSAASDTTGGGQAPTSSSPF